MKIALGCDHAGYELKESLKEFLKEEGQSCDDLGPDSPELTDYPDWAARVARLVSNGQMERGILICATGVGMSVVANKFPGVRAALVTDPVMARKSKEHNNSNILVLSSALTTKAQARGMVKEWLAAEFAGGKHKDRLEKIFEIERSLFKTDNQGRLKPEEE